MPGVALVGDLPSLIYCFKIICNFDLSPVYFEVLSSSTFTLKFIDPLSYSIFQASVIHNTLRLNLYLDIRFLAFFDFDYHNFSFSPVQHGRTC